jgi:hypothetical protein
MALAVAVGTLLPLGPWSLSVFALAMPETTMDQVSITLHSQPGGIALSGDASNSSALDLSTLVAFGNIGSGLTRSVAADHFTVSTPIGVKVTLSSGSSQSYTLLCSVDTSASLTTWQLSGTPLTSSQNAVAFNQSYNTVVAHTLAVTIPFGEPPGTFTRTIELVAVPN